MLFSLNISAQEKNISPSLPVLRPDTVRSDTLRSLKKISKDAIDTQVTYSAPGGYIINDIAGRKATIVKNGIVNYGEIEIKADSIIFNMETNHVYAVGVRDTTGKVVGKPAFKDGSQSFTSDTLEYNFKTKKAVIKNIVTKQDEGYLNSSVTKLLEDGTSNIYGSTYSTCDADTPHFYIYLRRAKVYPGKKIISGPAHLVVLGIPLPLGLPFGFFPIQTKRAASGLIIPKVHYEATRGYALTEGGYYFALNDYFDLTLKGSIFSNGSWLLSAGTSYNKLYKFSGAFAFNFADNLSGHRGLADFNENKNYSLLWNYNQSPKSHPGSRFSASVNMSSSGYDRNNSYNLMENITSTKSSSINYSKSWEGTPMNLSISANHSQNSSNKSVYMNLPNMNFSVSRIYPFRGLNKGGTKKWYEDLQFQYSAEFQNQIKTTDTLMFTNKMWEGMKYGFKHYIPFSYQLRPFRNFSITPSLTYNGVVFNQKMLPRWDAVAKAVRYDTINGFFYGQALNPTISAGYSPQIFGYFDFKNPTSRIQRIRHVMKPSVTFAFTPLINGLSSKMYRQVQVDTTGKEQALSIYNGNIYQPPSTGSKYGTLGFNLGNILGAKVFAKNDTTGKPKTISLIDNFDMATSYSIFAVSNKWSPVSMDFHTTLFENIGINASSHFSLYALNSKGDKISETFYYMASGKLLRLTDVSTGLDFSLDRFIKGRSKKKPGSASTAVNQQSASIPGSPDEETVNMNTGTGNNALKYEYDEYGYMKFDSPWTMNVRYSLIYSKPYLKSTVTQAISVNGTLQLTKKMNISYSTGYDLTRKDITMSQITVTRDLHCWDMHFSWVPNGYMKMWEFSIRVKASVLADLKYERRKDFHDNY